MSVCESIKNLLSIIKFCTLSSFTSFQKIYMIGCVAIILNIGICMIIEHFYFDVGLALVATSLAGYFLVLLISLLIGIYLYCKEIINNDNSENINITSSSNNNNINGTSLLIMLSMICTSIILSVIGFISSLIILLVILFD